MTKWEHLEEWLFENRPNGGHFTNRELAGEAGITRAEASSRIRSYLDAQRSPEARTLYVLHREGRTSRATWMAGVRTADARATSRQFFDDVKARFRRAVEPDLTAIARKNPRAARQCEAIVEAVGDSAMKLLHVAVGGVVLEEDGGRQG